MSYSVKLSADGFVCSVLASSRLSASPAVFLPLSVCPRWLSSGFSAVSSGVGGFSRFNTNAYVLRLSDIALCAFGRSVLPSAVVWSPFCPATLSGGLSVIRCRVLPFRSVTALTIGFIPFAPCQMWVDCLTFSGRSLRLGGRWVLYLCSVCPVGHLAQPFDVSQCPRVLYRSPLGRCPRGGADLVARQM